MDDHRRANRAVWDEWTGINASSDMYNLETFKAGRCSLKALELEELGEVQGKRLLHLQCHFGMDTLSWARRGARVTGVDFSPRAVDLAQALSRELDLPARFVCCDLYELPQQLDPAEKFDIVFTSYGALTWLSDRQRWAQIAASYVRTGGVFYIAEFHPFAMVFTVARLIIPIPAVFRLGEVGIETVVWTTVSLAAILPNVFLEWGAITGRPATKAAARA